MTSRLQIVSIRPETLLNFLNGGQGDYLQLPVIAKLPEGYEVVSVNADWLSHTIKILVEHPSFPEVEPGKVPHDFGEGLVTLRSLRLQRATDLAISPMFLSHLQA